MLLGAARENEAKDREKEHVGGGERADEWLKASSQTCNNNHAALLLTGFESALHLLDEQSGDRH